jgi:hypothetical protein
MVESFFGAGLLLSADRPSRTRRGETSLRPGPVMWVMNGKPIIQFTYVPLVGSERSPRSESLPEVNLDQRLAMEMLESTAQRFSHTLQREPGDVLFVNNLSVLHARDSFGNEKAMSAATNTSSKGIRHFLRLFVRDPERRWEKPEQLQTDLDEVFAPERIQHIPVNDTDPYLRFHLPIVHHSQLGTPSNSSYYPEPEKPRPESPRPPKPGQHG